MESIMSKPICIWLSVMSILMKDMYMQIYILVHNEGNAYTHMYAYANEGKIYTGVYAYANERDAYTRVYAYTNERDTYTSVYAYANERDTYKRVYAYANEITAAHGLLRMLMITCYECER
jgi:hypothetical protein